MHSHLVIRNAALVAGLILSAPALAADAAATLGQPGTIRVVAEATTVVKPDLAEVDLGVTTEKPTAAAATSENARKMDQIVEALKKEAGPGSEVKTVGFQVSPRWGEPRPNERQQPIAAYVVSNTVRVRVPDVNAVGRLMDRAFKLGANTVQKVSFTLKDPEPAQTEALRAAAAKARGRANAMASALGLKVAHVMSVSESQQGFTPWDGTESAQMMRANVGTPVEAGSLEIRASVTVVFAIASR
jgi:uncharacterized protein YggE